MSAKIFPTAQDAENAFYEALERCDLEAMMAVWSEDEEIVCVHPAGQRLAGQEQVREAWRQMFAGGPGMRVRTTQQVVIPGVMLAVHSVHENITVSGEQHARPPMMATNIYLRTAAGWRMILHHASPAAGEPPAAEPAPASSPKILH
ncbi:MAG TPA: nuclear transport factor 2 family protein [Burkholderiales bacterium]|nr:nuclear transport factor 2 family protein [Burkholderiales bacterium]